jgi:hypothetical protein
MQHSILYDSQRQTRIGWLMVCFHYPKYAIERKASKFEPSGLIRLVTERKMGVIKSSSMVQT